jgi:hypothetical protein
MRCLAGECTSKYGARARAPERERMQSIRRSTSLGSLCTCSTRARPLPSAPAPTRTLTHSTTTTHPTPTPSAKGPTTTAAGACSTSGRAPAVGAAVATTTSTFASPGRLARPLPHHPIQPLEATWSRPTPDRDQDWVKPSYVPDRRTQPDLQPLFRPEEPRPLYAPAAPEFAPADRPESPAQYEPKEGMPKMPERPRDPIPAGNPGKGKERPGEGGGGGEGPAREEPVAPAPDKK